MMKTPGSGCPGPDPGFTGETIFCETIRFECIEIGGVQVDMKKKIPETYQIWIDVRKR
jgi:hypothetical protein